MQKIIDKLVNKHNTYNPFEICSNLDIQILFMPLGTARGLCTKNMRIWVFIINSFLTHEQQEITCGHELGHNILGHRHNKFFMSTNSLMLPQKYENSADEFSARLRLKQYDKSDLTGLSIDQLSLMTGIKQDILRRIIQS